MTKSRIFKKILAVSCAGLLTIAVCAPTTFAWRNVWWSMGYDTGTSRTEAPENQKKSSVYAEVLRRKDSALIDWKEYRNITGPTVVQVSGAYRDDTYFGKGHVYFA